MKPTQRVYKCLPYQEFANGNYKLVPIREEDKYFIMQLRNEQIEILRQQEFLSKEKQDVYFKNVVENLFGQERPSQLLFSFLENERLIGYGGLVHIDWESKNGEISFLTETQRSNNEPIFKEDFRNYLTVIASIAFEFLQFIKLTTTVYEIKERITYLNVIEEFGFVREAELRKQILIKGSLNKVLIYSYFNRGK